MDIPLSARCFSLSKSDWPPAFRSGLQATLPGSFARGSALFCRSLALAILCTGLRFDVLANDPPWIAPITNQTTLVGTPCGPFPIRIGDTETPVGGLRLSGSSSDQSLVPNTNVFLYNIGFQSLTVTPVPGRTGSATITVTVSDGTNQTSTNFVLTVTSPPPQTAIFTSTDVLTIPQGSVADVYPSTNHVEGLPDVITNLVLVLNGFSHTATHDLELLLVGPGGQAAVVMAHAWGKGATNLVVGLDDTAFYPQAAYPYPMYTGTFKPTDYSNDVFQAPAPGGSYSNKLAAFKGTSPAGDWLLYAMNDPAGSGTGSISGWSLQISTGTPVVTAATPAILSLTGAGTTNVVITWSAVSNVTYRVQYRSDVGDDQLTNNWSALVPDVTATTNTASAVDNPAGDARRFYRVLVVQ